MVKAPAELLHSFRGNQATLRSAFGLRVRHRPHCPTLTMLAECFCRDRTSTAGVERQMLRCVCHLVFAFRSSVIRFFDVDTTAFNERDNCHDFQRLRLPMSVMILNVLLLDLHLLLT